MWKYVCWPCRMPSYLMRGSPEIKRIEFRESRTNATSVATEASKTTTIKTKIGITTEMTSAATPQSSIPENGPKLSSLQTNSTEEGTIEIIRDDSPRQT